MKWKREVSHRLRVFFLMFRTPDSFLFSVGFANDSDDLNI